MTKKKGKKMLSNLKFTKEEMEFATQVVAILDVLMAQQHPEAKFEHLALWWTYCDPAEA